MVSRCHRAGLLASWEEETGQSQWSVTTTLLTAAPDHQDVGQSSQSVLAQGQSCSKLPGVGWALVLCYTAISSTKKSLWCLGPNNWKLILLQKFPLKNFPEKPQITKNSPKPLFSLEFMSEKNIISLIKIYIWFAVTSDSQRFLRLSAQSWLKGAEFACWLYWYLHKYSFKLNCL